MANQTPPSQSPIRDEDPTTEGGPPGWMAFAVVGLAFLTLAALVMTLMYFTS